MKINLEGIKDEVRKEFEDIKEDDSLSGYYSFYVDPDDGTIYSRYEASGDSEPEAVWSGHDKTLLVIREQYYNDYDVDVDYEVEEAMNEITSRLKDLELI